MLFLVLENRMLVLFGSIGFLIVNFSSRWLSLPDSCFCLSLFEVLLDM